MNVKCIEVPDWSSPRRALTDVETDCERRDRGISLAAWNRAPSPPTTKRECTNGPRPCPALRCWFHCGDRGDGSLSCVLDVERPMSQAEVASVLGVSERRVRAIEQAAAAQPTMRKARIALGVLKRHA